MKFLMKYRNSVSMYSHFNAYNEETRRFYICEPDDEINYLSVTKESFGKELCLVDYANDEDIYERQVRTESSAEYIMFLKRYTHQIAINGMSDAQAFDYSADSMYNDRNA